MRLAALVSGGKDSVAAIDVARNRGWDVALALVLRVVGEDSWMFHRPNAHLAPTVAQAMGLPAIVAETRGEKEHEVDDLAALLERARDEARVEGVVTGALESEYQRVRIERAAHRVGLKSCAPLWRTDAGAHVATLVAAGYEIRFSSVSAEGLDASWLGERLDEQSLPRLLALSKRYRFHPAGEGGEYETLVLDGPGFAHRLIVDQASSTFQAGRGEWSVTRAHLEPHAPP